MEPTESNLQALANYLLQTLHPDTSIRKPAETFLLSVERNKNYPILLLNLVSKTDLDLTVRVAGAIVFKNYVKRNWKVDDEEDKIDNADRDGVKKLIVNLMLNSPDTIQRQLSDAISVIGREDFPLKWPQLLQEMIDKFQSGDFNVINGILHTAHSLFKRYRHEFKSNTLWEEIKFVLLHFAPPLTQLFINLMSLAKEHENNKEAVIIIYSSLVMVAKIFFSLNSQDLPEFFEDHMVTWMDNFHILLETENPLLKTAENDESGLLEQLKSQICDNVGLYARQYSDEFKTFLPKFVEAIWKLLVTTGKEEKYDMLVSNAIQFLALVADKDANKKLFEDPGTMSSICEKVIIPNMEFRASDEELFEDNAEEYIRRDIEGSDFDTRRRAACDLVRALSKHFEPQMTAIFGQYVQAMLVKYSENPIAYWKNKDAAIYLVTSVASKGKTEKFGATVTNELVNITDFYQAHILPELANANINVAPVLKADGIKFLMTFRSKIPTNLVKESLQYLITLLSAESQVTQSYASLTIDKILLIKNTENTALIKSSDLAPFAPQLLTNLFNIIEGSTLKENEHVMKCIMRSLSTLQEAVMPYVSVYLPKLTGVLVAVCKNPSKPNFNHYLFESLALSIRIVTKASPDSVRAFETLLFPIFQNILSSDVSEFIPYTFQILSLLLSATSGRIESCYLDLFPCLLQPVLWDRAINIRPLVLLLQTYLRKGNKEIIALGKINTVLGTFQKLLASRSNDHEGMRLLQTLFEEIGPVLVKEYSRPVFSLLFHRLTSSKTTKYVKCLLVFFGFYIWKFGVEAFVETVDGIQAKMFGMVCDRLFIAEGQKVSGKTEKATLCFGLVKMLTEAPQIMLSEDYVHYWVPLLRTLIGLFELPEDVTEVADEHFIELEENLEMSQGSYSQLAFLGHMDENPFAGVDLRLLLAKGLERISKENPETLKQMISMSLEIPAQNFLSSYMAAYGTQIF